MLVKLTNKYTQDYTLCLEQVFPNFQIAEPVPKKKKSESLIKRTSACQLTSPVLLTVLLLLPLKSIVQVRADRIELEGTVEVF